MIFNLTFLTYDLYLTFISCFSFPSGQINIFNSSIYCDVNINWTEFVGALTRILRSSNPNFLIK